jgi:hypothetical protein
VLGAHSYLLGCLSSQPTTWLADNGTQRRARSRVDSGHVERGQSGVIELVTEEVLDHAAWLLEASVVLHCVGLEVGAFALEGIQGRLLEVILGAGSVECSS